MRPPFRVNETAISGFTNQTAQLSYTATTTTAGGEESRPKNIALNFIIKH